MARALILLLAFVASSGAPSIRSGARLLVSPAEAQAGSSQSESATVKPVSEVSPVRDDESHTEQQLLALANQSRQQVGLPALALDSGLSKAALIHAQTMRQARQLSHQFDGEPPLPQRLAAVTHLQLDQEGENVALDYDAEHGHEHLMLSPPHRANLLNAAFNVVGMGVVRSGDRLYIVQDFGHALPSYSTVEAKGQIAAALNQMRQQLHEGELPRIDLGNADEAACSMAQADRLGTDPVQKLAARYTVLTYTSLHPDMLPNEAYHAINSRNLRSFSVGLCYRRSETYPSGVYWIVLTLD
ncbi:MAG TPA: CAP domain-containing protein [Candidatus Sulfotelmatobacter sp.]|nr:CAP domain-containing protein [Candidatus Sulfotelmatobacter sp.]